MPKLFRVSLSIRSERWFRIQEPPHWAENETPGTDSRSRLSALHQCNVTGVSLHCMYRLESISTGAFRRTRTRDYGSDERNLQPFKFREGVRLRIETEKVVAPEKSRRDDVEDVVSSETMLRGVASRDFFEEG